MEFESKGTKLRITTVDSFEPHPFAVLGWNVRDIENQVKTLSTLGVKFERHPSLPQDDLGIWTSPSKARIAWFCDPEGNLLSMTEYL